MRTTYKRADLDKERTPEQKAAFSEKLDYWRKHGTPGVVRDEASTPILSHADGKTYDSNSQYRKSLKAQGYEEVGDARPDTTPPKTNNDDLISDIKHAMGEL